MSANVRCWSVGVVKIYLFMWGCICMCVCMYVCMCISTLVCLSVEVVRLNIGSDLRLPFVSVVEKFLLIVQQLFMGFCGELKVGSLKKRKDIK